jgi:hypothetical protein
MENIMAYCLYAFAGLQVVFLIAVLIMAVQILDARETIKHELL